MEAGGGSVSNLKKVYMTDRQSEHQLSALDGF